MVGNVLKRAATIRQLSVLVFVGATLAARLQAQSFTQFPTSGDPAGIAAGPDGNLWFTENVANKIGRITTAGVVTEFSIPTPDSRPNAITTGPDGNLWFNEVSGDKIGRITPAGVITEFPLPNSSTTDDSIVSGPDGNLWFTEFSRGKIGRITPAGVISEFQTPADPAFIARGPDGNLWFTERLGNHVDRITPAGVITQFPTLTMSRLLAITAGPDGNLWFFGEADNKIGRITTGGVVSEFNLPGTAPHGENLTAGPDGNLWSTGDHEIARITTAGVVTEFAIPGSSFTVNGIVTGADGNLWFAEGDSKIGRFSLGLCTSSASNLCLNNGRFGVRANWQVPSQGTSGVGTAVQLTSDTGYFWFFSANNVEMVVKALNGCSFNSRYWVFAGGLTNVEVTLTVTDTQTGQVKSYLNPAATAFLPIQDTSAFSTCP